MKIFTRELESLKRNQVKILEMKEFVFPLVASNLFERRKNISKEMKTKQTNGREKCEFRRLKIWVPFLSLSLLAV